MRQRGVAPTRDRDIATVLARLGYSGAARERARAALEAAGLTNPRKSRISEAKLDRVRFALAERFALVCDDPACRAELASERPRAELVPVRQRTHCDSCAGSDNARASRGFVATCRASGVRRLVVVGGSPGLREELASLLGPRLELRLVDGTIARPLNRARADIAWADLIVVCGRSELTHQVSRQYTESARRNVLLAPRRGVAAMLGEATVFLERHRAT